MQTITLNPKTQGKHGIYNAVDFSPNPDPIYYAPEDGTITFWGENGTMGLALKMQGITGLHGFGHNERSLVKVGDKVKRGQPLAKMGYTGLTDPDDVPAGTHVHWVINRNGVYVYPPDLINETFIKQGGNVSTDAVTEQELKEVHYGALFSWPGQLYINAYKGQPLQKVIESLRASNNPLRGKVEKQYADGAKVPALEKEIVGLKAQLAAEAKPLAPGKYLVN